MIHAHGLRSQSRETGIDVVAARMPEAAPLRGIEPVGNRTRGLRVFVQQKRAHRRRRRHKPRAADRIIRSRPRRSFRRRRPAIDGFGQFGGAAGTVPHLPGDEAWVDRARPHDACERRRQCPRTRPLWIGDIKHDQIGGAAEHLRRRGKAADKGRVLAAFEKIAAGIVARMHKKVGVGDALRERAGGSAAIAGSAAVAVRGGRQIGGSNGFGIGAATKQILDACAVSPGAVPKMRSSRMAPLPSAARRAMASGFSSCSSSRAATA